METGKRRQTKEQRQKQAISRLKNENAKLREENKKLRQENDHLRSELENVLLRVDELTNIVFGRKKRAKKKYGFDDDDKPKKPRSSLSYQRKKPTEDEVTDTEFYEIDNCPDCETTLTRKQLITRYIEDIRIPVLEALGSDKDVKVKKVIKQEIEKGYCPNCKRWHSSIPISSKVATLGLQTKQLVAYSINVLRLTYSQTKNIIFDLYQIKISDGEITNILDKIATTLRPEFERLKAHILQAKSVHLDETGNQTGKDKNYSWILASGENEKAVFEIGKSRGKGNAEKLLQGYNGIRVTDCFKAYDKLPGEHQVCWVHILRKAKDLSVNSNLDESKRQLASLIHEDLKNIYKEVKTITQSKLSLKRRQLELPNLKEKLNQIIMKIENFHYPPQKLSDLKGQLERYTNQLFTCIAYKDVAPENNHAERKLRHLVLKRKNSFGTKTEKGNQILSVNLSVLMSLWWEDRDNFWPRFNQLLA
jgi:hypothetical protein